VPLHFHKSFECDRASQLRDWLVANGWDDIFLDLDPGPCCRGALEGGAAKAAQRCEAVLALIRPEWLASAWCRPEVNAAQLMGKKIIVLLVEKDKTGAAHIDVEAIRARAEQIQLRDEENNPLQQEVRAWRREPLFGIPPRHGSCLHRRYTRECRLGLALAGSPIVTKVALSSAWVNSPTVPLSAATSSRASSRSRFKACCTSTSLAVCARNAVSRRYPAACRASASDRARVTSSRVALRASTSLRALSRSRFSACCASTCFAVASARAWVNFSTVRRATATRCRLPAPTSLLPCIGVDVAVSVDRYLASQSCR
jgi:TIR domain-containing protein